MREAWSGKNIGFRRRTTFFSLCKAHKESVGEGFADSVPSHTGKNLFAEWGKAKKKPAVRQNAQMRRQIIFTELPVVVFFFSGLIWAVGFWCATWLLWWNACIDYIGGHYLPEPRGCSSTSGQAKKRDMVNNSYESRGWVDLCTWNNW